MDVRDPIVPGLVWFRGSCLSEAERPPPFWEMKTFELDCIDDPRS
jgi:hypothetical protein